MGGYQNYGPFLGTPNIRCRIIIGIQKGTIIFTTNHMSPVSRVALGLTLVTEKVGEAAAESMILL